MKFFDYKILLLLGLTIVIYFIYREIENIRNRITTLENEIKNKPTLENNNLENNTTNQPNQPNTIILDVKQDIDLTIPTKVINMDMYSTTTHLIDTNFKHSITSSKHSTSSKHLAIYSNDNDPYELTQNSLLESLKFDYNNASSENFNNISNFDILIPNIDHQLIDTTSENNLIDTTLENNLVETTSEDQPNETNTNNNLVETTSENNLIDTTLEKNLIETTSEDQPNETNTNNNLVETTSEDQPNETNNNLVEINKYTKEYLNKLKLPELKKIAELKKITITHKIGKQQKPKNKQELINDILLKK